MKKLPYEREMAVRYARTWAFDRNPKYYDFEHIGGDCTNFVSQCLFAGCGVMNFTPNTGWYYRSLSDRAPAWSSVEYLFRFLTQNNRVGPIAEFVKESDLLPGDIIQLGNESGRFYHSLIVTQISPKILVSAHSYDALDRPLQSYEYDIARFLHVTHVLK